MIGIVPVLFAVVMAMLALASDLQAASEGQSLGRAGKYLTFVLAAMLMTLVAWAVSAMRGWRLRRAVAAGRMTRRHVEALMLVVERFAGSRATRLKDLRTRFDLNKKESKLVLKELRRFGCAKPGDLGGFVPTDVGIEFLRSVDLGEFAMEANELLEEQERLRRLCTLAVASGAGSSGGDGTGG
jgi:hypothetical protein